MKIQLIGEAILKSNATLYIHNDSSKAFIVIVCVTCLLFIIWMFAGRYNSMWFGYST